MTTINPVSIEALLKFVSKDIERIRLMLQGVERNLSDVELWLKQIKKRLSELPLTEPTPFPVTPRTTPIPQSRYYCSFCGKAQDEVANLIAGPGSVFICNECVQLCHEIEQKRLAKLNTDSPQ